MIFAPKVMRKSRETLPLRGKILKAHIARSDPAPPKPMPRYDLVIFGTSELAERKQPMDC